MGRVYNALVKADRLPGRERPIGRPASASSHGSAARVGVVRPDGAVKSAGRLPSREVSDRREDQVIEFSFNRDSAATAPTFQSDGGFSLTETLAAPAGFAPAEFAPASPTPQQPPAPVFQEPRETASIRSLTIDPHLVALTGHDSLAQERYRSLGVRVLNAASGHKMKAVVVTSAEHGEGKSTVAINLAWVMAKRAHRRVLLLDASLRSPSVGRMLGLAPARGWLSLTGDLSDLADVMVRLDPNGLYVMALATPSARAGRQDAGAGISDSLISSGFEDILAGLSRRFDLVVIDAPPVLASADAQHLASVAGGTVIVARSGVTHRGRVNEALALVPEDRRIGIVLNESEVSERATPHGAGRSLIGRLFGRGR